MRRGAPTRRLTGLAAPGAGAARHEPQCEAPEDQHDRVRDADAARQRVEAGHRHQHRGEDYLESLHAQESGDAVAQPLDEGARSPPSAPPRYDEPTLPHRLTHRENEEPESLLLVDGTGHQEHTGEELTLRP